MSSFEDQEDKRQVRKRERKNAEVPTQSSRIGYMIILLCVAIGLIGSFVTQQFDEKVQPQPKAFPTDAVRADALSSTWTCPISGAGTDTLLLSNPSRDTDGQVDVTAFDAAGVVKGSVTVSLKAGATEKLEVGAVAADASTSIVVQSYSSPVVVIRNTKMTDGNELVACINEPVSQADFPNLNTLRNVNSVLVIANPYDVAIVVDLSASLTDTSVSPASTVLDDDRGIIVPAFGRVNVDLQAEFGRYPVVSIHAQSRSGFFVAEVLLSYSGADSVTGQTIVARSHETDSTTNTFWVGVAPSRIVTKNDSNHTHTIQVDALASDNRSITGEGQIIAAGTATVLDNVGADFSTRLMTLAIVKSSNRPTSIFTSWIYASGNAVSSGSSTLGKTKRAFVPVAVGDSLHLYNPNETRASVEVAIYGTSSKINVELDALQFKTVSLAGLGLDVSTILNVESAMPIVSGAGDSLFTRYAQGIDIRS